LLVPAGSLAQAGSLGQAEVIGLAAGGLAIGPAIDGLAIGAEAIFAVEVSGLGGA